MSLQDFSNFWLHQCLGSEMLTSHESCRLQYPAANTIVIKAPIMYIMTTMLLIILAEIDVVCWGYWALISCLTAYVMLAGAIQSCVHEIGLEFQWPASSCIQQLHSLPGSLIWQPDRQYRGCSRWPNHRLGVGTIDSVNRWDHIPTPRLVAHEICRKQKNNKHFLDY